MINLDDFVTDAQHFKWREVLYLPSWKIYHTPSDSALDRVLRRLWGNALFGSGVSGSGRIGVGAGISVGVRVRV